MSMGSPRVTIRVPRILLADIGDAIARYNRSQTCRSEINLTDFLRKAVVDRLSKLERSNRRRHDMKPRNPTC